VLRVVGYRDLTAAETAALHAELAPVLADLGFSDGLKPGIIERSCVPGGGVSCFLHQDGLGGPWGITVRDSLPPARRLANLAYQVQDWAVEALWLADSDTPWPLCAAHPKAHPLVPAVAGTGEAVWRCPHTKSDVCAIGCLTSSG
jgi:hypothetical protein